MPCTPVEQWLQSGRAALIGSHCLKPVEHKLAKGKPLSSQKGQAEAFFLVDASRSWWILKKFRPGCSLDSCYLEKVASVLPKDPGFTCGTERCILATGVLRKAKGYHHSRGLDRWLDGTILMPRVKGVDWAGLADEIRDGEVVLEQSLRLTLCRNLTRLVELLEAHGCAHRDLSCGNVFVVTGTGEVCLIDFDSLYHPSVVIPNATTCGTEGYTAPYAWASGNLDPRRTWSKGADRYALALLNAELLLTRKGTAATGEGGMFKQEELKCRRGPGIDSIVAELRADYPQAAVLLRQAIQSQTPAECPSPQSWNSSLQSTAGTAVALPTLADLPDPVDEIAERLARARPAAPLWHVPSLQEVPAWVPQRPAQRHITMFSVQMPADPWANGLADRHATEGSS